MGSQAINILATRWQPAHGESSRHLSNPTRILATALDGLMDVFDAMTTASSGDAVEMIVNSCLLRNWICQLSVATCLFA